MEFLIALIYLSLNIKISNYHPCLEADVNEKEKCPNYNGPHMYLEDKYRNLKHRYNDIFEGEDLPWVNIFLAGLWNYEKIVFIYCFIKLFTIEATDESLNLLTIPWNPFLKNVERKIGKKYPDVWVSLPRIIDHPSREDIPIFHPYMPRDYYKNKNKIRIENTKKAEINNLPVLASITFAILAKFCTIWALYWKDRYKVTEESEMEILTINV